MNNIENWHIVNYEKYLRVVKNIPFIVVLYAFVMMIRFEQ